MAAAVAALRERQMYINFGILLPRRQHRWCGALRLVRLAFASWPNDGEVLSALRALLQRLNSKDKEVRMKEIKRRQEREEREK
jgi:hypothetical protein